MNDSQTGRYGGVGGRVLVEAISGSSFLTGLALVIPSVVLGFLLLKAGADSAGMVVGQILATLALARFALNGMAGQWRGTVFSSYGGSGFDVLSVSFRFVLLTAVWMIPIYIIGFRPEESVSAFGMMAFGMGGGKAVALAAIYIACLALSPPVFLIVSVGASNIFEIFSPGHWSSLFSGRKGDLFLIYSLYLGGVAMVSLILLPMIVLVGAMGPKAMLLFVALSFVFLLGMAITVLGRLCGFFAASTGNEEGHTAEPVPDLAPMGATSTVPERMVTTPLVSRVMEAHGERPTVPLQKVAPAEPPTPEVEKVPDVVGFASAAEQLFESNPEKAIEDLEGFEKRYGPNPVILCLLSRLKLRLGPEQEALVLAHRALTFALQKGAHKQAAETMRAFLESIDRLDLTPEEVLRLGNVLRTMDDLDAAARVYSWLIEKDQGDAGAIKGLLQVAELYVQRKGTAEAITSYQFLIDHCPDSPLGAYMQEGLAEAQRKMVREA